MNQEKIRAPRFSPLPLGSIQPTGWLRRQLRIQADGLSGHLDEFWPDVQDSRWFGGEMEGWERAPYWLDGLIPLAYVLQDEILIDKARRYISYILDHQYDDGWLGPKRMVVYGGGQEAENYDIWAQFLILKALCQVPEANFAPRIEAAVAKCLANIDRHIDRAPLFNWGQFRWYEALIPIFWLYERTGEGWLYQLAVKLQAQGFHWGEFFKRWPLTVPTPKGRWNFMGHVVNNAMAVKAHGLWWRISGEDGDRAAVDGMLNKLDTFHGMVTGMFSGDECLAGKSPTQGSELCSVVEFAYSMEVLLSIFGDAAFGDRLEKVVFNALPATFSPDMWGHQYDQQVNQIECSIRENRTWNTNGVESNIFGVDPNYGCCTANLSQGWPKFAAHLWMESTDGGLALTAYAPNKASLRIDNVLVEAEVETGYPFREHIRLNIRVAKPCSFPLWLRIPTWAQAASVRLQGVEISGVQAGDFYRLEREWVGTTEIEMHFPMQAKLLSGYRGAVGIERGPLVYALPIEEDWRRVHADYPYRELPHADWEVYPRSPWNYALQIQAESLGKDLAFVERPIGDNPFSPTGAPVSAAVQGKQVHGWASVNGSAADVPLSPVISNEPLETLKLIPYGCTNLRMAEFPILERD